MKDIIERIRELPADTTLEYWDGNATRNPHCETGIRTDDLKQMAEELANLRKENAELHEIANQLSMQNNS